MGLFGKKKEQAPKTPVRAVDWKKDRIDCVEDKVEIAVLVNDDKVRFVHSNKDLTKWKIIATGEIIERDKADKFFVLDDINTKTRSYTSKGSSHGYGVPTTRGYFFLPYFIGRTIETDYGIKEKLDLNSFFERKIYEDKELWKNREEYINLSIEKWKKEQDDSTSVKNF